MCNYVVQFSFTNGWCKSDFIYVYAAFKFQSKLIFKVQATNMTTISLVDEREAGKEEMIFKNHDHHH